MSTSDRPNLPNLREVVADLLFISQLIEWGLREYISNANEAADRLLQREGVRFKPRLWDLRGKTLGQLVHLFAAHSDRDDLVARLRTFNERRNLVVHRIYVYVHTGDGREDRTGEAVGAISRATSEATSILQEVLAEALKANKLATNPRAGESAGPSNESA